MRAALLLSLVLLSAGPTLAQEITVRTGCAVAVRAYDTQDLATVATVNTFIESEMQALDAHHTDNGEPGIIAGMNDQQIATLVAAAIGYCRRSPKATIYNETYQLYDGIRGLAIEAGQAK